MLIQSSANVGVSGHQYGAEATPPCRDWAANPILTLLRRGRIVADPLLKWRSRFRGSASLRPGTKNRDMDPAKLPAVRKLSILLAAGAVAIAIH